jgi:hypothetical protein
MTNNINFEKVIREVLAYYDMTDDSMFRKSKKMVYAEPRQLCQYFMWVKSKLTKSAIARIFRCNHATVIHNIKVIENTITWDKEFKELVRILETRIEGHIDKTEVEKVIHEYRIMVSQLATLHSRIGTLENRINVLEKL